MRVQVMPVAFYAIALVISWVMGYIITNIAAEAEDVLEA